MPRQGRKPNPNKAELKELARLKRENQRLAEKLRRAELIIEVQKKVSEMMNALQPEQDE
jgi:transposase